MKTRHKVFLIILTFFMLSSVLAIVARPTGDGAWHFGIVRFTAENQKLPMFEPLGRVFFARPPLYHVVSAGFYFIFGLINTNLAELIVRLLPCVFASLCLYLSFLIVKKLFNKNIAVYATLFLAFLPLYFFAFFRTLPAVLGMLLTTIALYFALEKRFALSGLFTGLSLLTKEQSFFIIFPILFIIIFSNIDRKKTLVKNAFLFLFLTAIIASPTYINTYIKLGDPIWPHGYFLFDSPYKQEGAGVATLGRTPLSISNILSPEYSLVQPYLEFFGVPHSTSTQVLFFFDIPFLKMLLGFWLVGTLVYILPLVYGFWKIKKHSFRSWMLVVWFGSFLMLFYFYLFVAGNSHAGHLLSGLPALAAVWGFGFLGILKRFGSFKKLILLFYILIILGFVSSAFIKVVYTNNAYQLYQEDYDWIKANVPETQIVYFNSQSLTYNTHGFSRSFSNITNLRDGFVLVNQNYKFNSGLAILPEETLREIEGSSSFVMVYSNNRTGSRIYEIKDSDE